MMANKQANGCPECGSAIYIRVNEKNASRRECADCGATYTVRLSTHQRALLVEAEVADE
jgi:DNA-directed RNA polymerase subunit M/transcription elongation factor TFIIS